MNRKLIPSGTRIGNRVVLRERGRTENGYIRYEVECDCGMIDIVNGSILKAGKADRCRSCAMKGKYVGKKNLNFKHGYSYHKNRPPVYNVWVSMRSRCNNPNDHQYSDYGGRGIKVCQEWNSFEVFLNDMGHPPAGYQIDRIDNNAGYCKENCRWVTHQENSNNRRNNRYYKINGEMVSKQKLLKTLGISKDSLRWKFFRMGEEAVFRLYLEKLSP